MNSDQLELALGLTMYREKLNDVNAHSDEWPNGITTNLGELDVKAEKLLRIIWDEYDRVEQTRILLMAERSILGE